MNKSLLFKSELLGSLWNHRELIIALTNREIRGPYKGGALGISWGIVSPVAMLTIYSFIFSQIFQARWGGTTGGPVNFALNLFSGLIAFNIFSESARKSTRLISDNPNFVKKIIFPLEVLGMATVATSCFHAVLSLSVLLIFKLLFTGGIPFTTLWLPVIWIPLVLGSLATTWLLSAVGVFSRDSDQAVNLGLSLLMFITPIFYPLNALPDKWQTILRLNPLSSIVDQTKRACIDGVAPNSLSVAASIILAMLICEVCLRIFNKSRREFADEL